MARVLRLAVAQPHLVLGDLDANVARHVDVLRGLDAEIVVFPELSLTGYDMGVSAVDPGDERLEPLVDACAAASMTALVGAPTRTRDGAGRHISVLRVGDGSVEPVYAKQHLGGEEPAHFTAGPDPVVIGIGGIRLGLAVCKDNGVAEHAAAVAELGMDVYVAGVCETELNREVQPMRAAAVVREHGVSVAYASFAGPTGGGFSDTAGRSAVVGPDGRVRVRLPRGAGHAGWTSVVLDH